MLSKDQILNANDVKLEEVNIPEWNGSVYVRVMSAGERDSFEIQATKPNGKQNLRARLAVLTVCDKDGNRIFEESDIPALAKKSASALDAIFRVAIHLNAMTDADIEELEKN